MTSCSPQKRLERLFDRMEKISDKNNLSITTKDTIYNTKVFTEIDTFYIDSSEISKTFDIKELDKNQTFILEDERIKTKITFKPQTRFKPARLDVETKAKAQTIIQHDTVKIEVPTYYDRKIFIREYRAKWYDWILRFLFLIFCIYSIMGLIGYFKGIAKR